MGSDRTVAFFLGAGASAKADVPGSAELTRMVLSDLQGKNAHEERSDLLLNSVVSAFIGHRGRDGKTPYEDVNIEDVVAACLALADGEAHELAPFVHAWNLPRLVSGIHRDECEGAILQLRSGICRYLYVTTPEKVTYLKPALDLLSNQKKRLICTLNYDNTIELLCHHLGIGLNYGIEPLSQFDTNRENGKIELLKLHGSVDWAWSEGQDFDQSAFLEPPIVQVPSDQIEDSPSSSRGKARVMLFGHGSKLQVWGPFLALLERFKVWLRDDIDDLVIVGYSFGDSHINYLLYRWLSAKILTKLVIIDKQDFMKRNFSDWYSGELQSHFKGRVVAAHGNAEDLLPRVGDYLD